MVNEPGLVIEGRDATRAVARLAQLRAMEFELEHGFPIRPAWGRVWVVLRREFGLPLRCSKRAVYGAFVARFCEPTQPEGGA